MLMQYFERVESDSAPRNELPKVGCVILEYDESHDDDNHNECMYYKKHSSNNMSNVKIGEKLNKLHKDELLSGL